MFNIFRKRKIRKYTDNASEYLKQIFIPEVPKSEYRREAIKEDIESKSTSIIPDKIQEINFDKTMVAWNDSGVRYSISESRKAEDELKTDNSYADIRYTDRTLPVIMEDNYDSDAVSDIMQKHNLSEVSASLLEELDAMTNKTFVDALAVHMKKKGMIHSEVYKAAQIDRRLFSKLMSNRLYKPAKDTAIAIAIALKLSLDETNDLLSRAGYTFSHSNKKDIIIEYFFRKQIYNLDDINQVLFNLNQKIIGR